MNANQHKYDCGHFGPQTRGRYSSLCDSCKENNIGREGVTPEVKAAPVYTAVCFKLDASADIERGVSTSRVLSTNGKIPARSVVRVPLRDGGFADVTVIGRCPAQIEYQGKMYYAYKVPSKKSAGKTRARKTDDGVRIRRAPLVEPQPVAEVSPQHSPNNPVDAVAIARKVLAMQGIGMSQAQIEAALSVA